jgi:hypothetical protein
MSEAYLTNWAMGSHFDDRDRFHDVALHEARIATERRPATPYPAPADSFIDRLRLALGRPAPMDACDCPVAA